MTKILEKFFVELIKCHSFADMIMNVFIIAFVVYFMKVTSWKGHIFEKPGQWLEDNLPEKLYKPLIGCPVCMTPWWGTLIYYICNALDIEQFSDGRIQVVLLTVFAAAGVNSVILMFNKLYDEAKDSEKLIEKKLKNESSNKESNKG